ncbi:MAG: AAA family ATPase [Magnetococcales bacterium]|nr:AAA family ATPase [Magnetococcales bacterium]
MDSGQNYVYDNTTDEDAQHQPLNQILYGPPGTGKTHHTIDEALAILDPGFLIEHRANRAQLRARFSELEASGHVRFVTFHQSFSYEDFVEGLRAEPDENTGQLKFFPMPGIFKVICEDATTRVVVDQVPESDLQAQQGPQARVLIIDEINRGNISRIFGELITLIEPNKRAGNSEALSVVLPYSKKTFCIPNNLYLIGTMNTSDRSLANLDIALRRRFVFKEMPPRPELLAGVNVGGIDIEQLLTIMNLRIEALLDRERCLGHAYFLPLREDPTIERLALIFQEQIMPLFKEYFFDDWERISWVLNDHRKLLVNRFVLPDSANMSELFGDDFEGKVQAKIWEINSDAFERVDAYLGVIDHTAVPSTRPSLSAAGAVDYADRPSFGALESVEYDGYRIDRDADTTITVFKDGVKLVAYPVLRRLAEKLRVSCLNSKGNNYNTRQLGWHVMTAIKEKN